MGRGAGESCFSLRSRKVSAQEAVYVGFEDSFELIVAELAFMQQAERDSFFGREFRFETGGFCITAGSVSVMVSLRGASLW